MKNIIKKYKALYKGELLEKIHRKIIVKTKLSEKYFSIPSDIFFEYNNIKIQELKINEMKEFFVDFSNYEIMNEKINFFNYEFKDNSKSKKWFYSNINKNGDIKTEWEINRLQFLPIMAVTFLKTKDDRFLLQIKKIIKEWHLKNPYEIGINWFSNLEVAIRSISLLITYIMLYDYLKSDEIEKVIFFHGVHIFKDIRYTEKCIPNNHLIGEASALYILGNFFSSEYSEIWIKKAKKILLKYLNHLNDDGTYKEGSLSYHRFVLQMYLITYFVSKKFNDNFLNEKFEKKLLKSYMFLKNIEKPDGTYPQYGDWDNGVYFNLNDKKIEDYKSFTDTLGYIIGLNKDNYEINILESIFEDIKITKKNFYESNYEIYEVGKYGVYKDEEKYVFINNQDQIFHSHSDGLSLEISIKGNNILKDSGTYNYNIDGNLRKYFRSTVAHNTVFLGKDQSTQIGNFRWVDQSKSYLEKLSDKKGFSGKIFYRDKSFHQRSVLFERGKIIIEDDIESSNNFIEINFHFSEDIILENISNNKLKINNSIILSVSSDKNFKTIITESYYSKSYNKIQKRPNLKIISNNKKQEFIAIFNII